MNNVILHLGLGAFHRAHQADYTQDAVGDWSIEAVSMRNPEPAEALNTQGGRFHLLTRGTDATLAKEITSISKAYSLPHQPQAVIARLAAQEVKVVTLTVTEKGYACDLSTKEPIWSQDAVQHDLASPGKPKTVLGLLCDGLRARKDAGGRGLTILSCDNLPSNGDVIKGALMQFSAKRDPILASWIEDQCCFPSSMVDRITPAATAETRKLVHKLTGQEDRLAIETEPFRQWVIEDDFAVGRPDWQSAGAIFTQDVAQYEKIKLRLLNGSHSLIAYLGAALDFEFVRDVMEDPQLGPLISKHLDTIAGTVDAPDGFNVSNYSNQLCERFLNPNIDHRCLQIAMDGSQKLPQRIYEPAAKLLETGGPIQSCIWVVSLWMRYLTGKSESGSNIEVVDPIAQPLGYRLLAAKSAVEQVEVLVEVAGGSFAPWSNPKWRDALVASLSRMEEVGVRNSLSLDAQLWPISA